MTRRIPVQASAWAQEIRGAAGWVIRRPCGRNRGRWALFRHFLFRSAANSRAGCPDCAWRWARRNRRLGTWPRLARERGRDRRRHGASDSGKTILCPAGARSKGFSRDAGGCCGAAARSDRACVSGSGAEGAGRRSVNRASKRVEKFGSLVADPVRSVLRNGFRAIPPALIIWSEVCSRTPFRVPNSQKPLIIDVRHPGGAEHDGSNRRRDCVQGWSFESSRRRGGGESSEAGESNLPPRDSGQSPPTMGASMRR